MLTIAHISDTHVDGTERAAARVRAVMSYLDDYTASIDLVLVTGDITDHGLADEYREARELLVSRHPVLVLPGNHDVRGPFAEVLLGAAWNGGPVDAAHRVGGALFVLCDSSIPARDGERVDEGLLEDVTLEWLDRTLASASPHDHLVVAMHHPPVDVHIPLMDPIRLTNPDALADVLTRHPRVVAVLVGHAHTAGATTFAGLPLLIAPGVASTVVLPGEGGPRVNHSMPPGLALHLVDAAGRVMSHFRFLT